MTNVQYVTDAQGHKTAVILPIDEFEELLEDLHFAEAAREQHGDQSRDFDDVLKEMREAREIDV